MRISLADPVKTLLSHLLDGLVPPLDLRHMRTYAYFTLALV